MNEFEETREKFVQAYQGTYDKERAAAEESMAVLEKGAVRKHYSNMGKKMNAKKGFGSNKESARINGAKGGKSVRDKTTLDS